MFRGRGVVARLRALFLLLAVVVGSILARDALFISRCAAIVAAKRSAVVELDSAPQIVDAEHNTKLKLRPSGLSKRAAWSPFDDPGDDDETDEDSDTLSPNAFLAVLAPEPPRVGPRLALEIAEQHATSVVVVRSPLRTAVSSRGPPTATFVSLV